MSSYASLINPESPGSPPPSYNQVFERFEMAATAPISYITLSSSIFGTATSLRFEFDSTSSSGFSFLIRDYTNLCVQAKGELTNLQTTLMNVNGIEMLKIIKTDANVVNERIVQTFHVHHDNLFIGAVKVAEEGPVESCLQIVPGNAEMTVASLKIGGFAIFRGNSSSNPICNIEMDYTDQYKSGEFNGTIIFHTETEITTQEQFLCTAAAIAFKLVRKEVTRDEGKKKVILRWIGGIVVIAIICGLILLIVKMLLKWKCEEKKAEGQPRYVDRDC